MRNALLDEKHRLTTPPGPDETPGGVGTVRFIVWCPSDATEILTKALSLLKLVNEQSLKGWPAQDDWEKLLPKWFLSRCAPEWTVQQAEAEIAQLKLLSPEEQIAAEQSASWTLSAWLYYLEPGRRYWYWWDGMVVDPTVIFVAVEVSSWPFPWGSLDWLFRAAGAESVRCEA